MRADRGGWNATVLEFRRAASAITCFLEGRIHGLDSVSVEMENNTKHPLNILIDPLTFKSFADSSVKMIKKRYCTLSLDLGAFSRCCVQHVIDS